MKETCRHHRLAQLLSLAAIVGTLPAFAQVYDPADGPSPLSLLQGPGDGVAYYETKVRARQLFADGKFAEAEPLAERLARDYPRDPENWQLLADSKQRLGEHAEAVTANARGGPLIGWGLAWAHGYYMAANQLAAGDRKAALATLRTNIFDRHGFWREDLYNWKEFEPLRADREFLDLIGRVDTTGWDRTRGWNYDIDFLVSELKRVNPDYMNAPLPPELLARRDALKRDVPKLSDEQIFIGMQRMLALLHQGHVFLSPGPETITKNRFLPVRLYAFPEGIFIIDADDAHRDLIGSKVLAFGPLSAEEALRRMGQAISAEGDMAYVYVAALLGMSFELKGMGATSSAERVSLSVQKPGAKARTIELSTLEGPHGGRPDVLVAPAGVAPPLFLAKLDQRHWQQAIPAHDALYLQLNAIRPNPDETLDQLADKLRIQLGDDKGPHNLILDLRHNNGGDTSLYTRLLRTLIAFRQRPGTQLYVLIGRRTYSAAANFVTDLERLADPVFVGEATGQCCSLYGDPIAVRLPYSKVIGELTAVKWQLLQPGDHRRELSPEVPVVLSAADYFAGRDPALDAVDRLIDEGPEGAR